MQRETGSIAAAAALTKQTGLAEAVAVGAALIGVRRVNLVLLAG